MSLPGFSWVSGRGVHVFVWLFGCLFCFVFVWLDGRLAWATPQQRSLLSREAHAKLTRSSRENPVTGAACFSTPFYLFIFTSQIARHFTNKKTQIHTHTHTHKQVQQTRKQQTHKQNNIIKQTCKQTKPIKQTENKTGKAKQKQTNKQTNAQTNK